MENEKLNSKIKNISRISVVGLIAYIGIAAYAMFPDAKQGFIDGWNDYEKNGLDDVSDFAAVLGFPVSVVMIVALVIAIVAGLQLLFGMSRGASPFTEKISRAIKNMGVSLIVFEVSKALFMYMYEETIEIGMLWLAGLVLYAFSLVFRYGTVLQKESDETL
ncbi:DUF2975 domain-containing protein [Ruminococcus flavefaciens]|uniref:DUF2975 family protein n=1 Tax=Ruminococcus flavefaciens TaxID=1265 RepID=A0A1K1Q1Z2_RUMFL|nr:DUF2975 domain-containing protein [Ruminococcus flavefaciens]SFW53780.1 Protein of unknown function [Ruminococcus flavefaciens]